MDSTLLRKAGLTDSQAAIYTALLRNESLTPVQLSKITGESRNNAYAIADKLTEYGLVLKTDQPKVSYSALHPSALEAHAEKRRKQLVRDEQIVKQGISPLIDMFYALRELPGTRTIQGIEGIKAIYEDILETNEDVYMLPTAADKESVGSEYLNEFFKRRSKLGIHIHAITPNTAGGRKNYKDGRDERLLFNRTFIPRSEFISPVEIQVFGNKCAFIAHGKTQMATIIDSPPIAQVMRSLFEVIIELATPESDKIKTKLQ